MLSTQKTCEGIKYEFEVPGVEHDFCGINSCFR